MRSQQRAIGSRFCHSCSASGAAGGKPGAGCGAAAYTLTDVRTRTIGSQRLLTLGRLFRETQVQG